MVAWFTKGISHILGVCFMMSYSCLRAASLPGPLGSDHHTVRKVCPYFTVVETETQVRDLVVFKPSHTSCSSVSVVKNYSDQRVTSSRLELWEGQQSESYC